MSGQLQVNDIILQVNNKNLDRMTYRVSSTLLKVYNTRAMFKLKVVQHSIRNDNFGFASKTDNAVIGKPLIYGPRFLCIIIIELHSEFSSPFKQSKPLQNQEISILCKCPLYVSHGQFSKALFLFSS